MLCIRGVPVEQASSAAADQLPARTPTPPWPDCKVDYAGARPTVRVSGRANRVTINEVSGVIRGLRAVGIRHLVIDMSAALDCDPRLLRVLARAHTQLADDAGALRITGGEAAPIPQRAAGRHPRRSVRHLRRPTPGNPTTNTPPTQLPGRAGRELTEARADIELGASAVHTDNDVTTAGLRVHPCRRAPIPDVRRSDHDRRLGRSY